MGGKKRKASHSSSDSSSPITREWLCLEEAEFNQNEFFSLLTDVVYIHIHGQEKPITVHAGILGRASKWLSARMDLHRNIAFDEEYEPQTIKMFLVWLYSGVLMAPMIEEPEPYACWNEIALANLYVFAWSFEVRALKNDVVTVLVQNYAQSMDFLNLATVKLVVNKCGVECGFIQFLAYHRAHRGLRESSMLPEDLAEYPSAFLAAVLKEHVHIKELRESKMSKVGFSAELPCRWHEHSTIEEKEKCQEKLLINS